MNQKIVVITIAVLFAAGTLMMAFVDYQPDAPPPVPSEIASDSNAGSAPSESSANGNEDDEFEIRPSDYPDVVATVNGVDIKRELFIKIIRGMKEQVERGGETLTKRQFDSIKGNIIDTVVNSEVLSQEAESAGFATTDEEVRAALDKLKSQYKSDEEYSRELVRQGFTEESLLAEIGKSMRINKLLGEKVFSQIKIDDEMAKKYYDENADKFTQPEMVGARHILLKLAPDAPDETVKDVESRMASIQQELEKGEPFDALAKKYSEGPSALKGGELGFFPRGAMVKEFEDTAFSMKAGDKPRVTRTRFGLHLIETTGKREGGLQPFEEVKEIIVRNLDATERNGKMESFISGLRSKADIKSFL